MKTAFLAFFVTLASFSFALAQPAQNAPARLYINDTRILPRFVEIEYDITYGGFVELHLFNEAGEKIWIRGIVNDKLGTYVFRIPSEPLETGKRYSFYLMYKGERYDGSFYAA